jgi:hypothetical protein
MARGFSGPSDRQAAEVVCINMNKMTVLFGIFVFLVAVVILVRSLL